MQRTSVSYLLTGVGLTVLLMGSILFSRHLRPLAPTAAADFRKAKGPVKAPVQLMEFSDFQCPACRVAQGTLSKLIETYPAKIRLVFQHFPLEGHRWSALAHQAAECASEQDRFWLYHDRLYNEQSAWSILQTPPLGNFFRYAKEEGLDLDRFSRCLVDPAINQRIRQERATGAGLGVRSTPSFFVNGKLVVGTESLRQEVEKAAR